MIKRKNHNLGINANVSLEPNAASSSNKNFNNNIYVLTPYPATEHQEYVKETYYLSKELRKTQYEELISDINYKITHIPEHLLQSTKKFISEESIKEAYKNDCLHEIELIEQDMNNILLFTHPIIFSKRYSSNNIQWLHEPV